jgi:hypothetical protein
MMHKRKGFSVRPLVEATLSVPQLASDNIFVRSAFTSGHMAS